MKAIVIGAGPAGLTAAYQLAKKAAETQVFEAADCVGGLARSIKLWGLTVDLGPHRFFSQDRRVNELWLEVAGQDYAMVNRQTRILYQKKLFKYPLEALDALGKLGLVEAVRCVGSYAKECVRPSSSPRPSPPLRAGEREKESESFEDWVCQRFGRRLFEIFFKNYSEKLWGISCQELDADFAAQRIKQFSLSAAIKAALLPGGGKKHRTLVDEFAYPTGGSGMVYERMAEAIRNRGGQVHLNTPVRKVLVERGKVVGIELSPSSNKSNDTVPLSPRGTNGERAGERGFLNLNASSPRPSPPFGGGEGESAAPVRLACDQVISTMPLTTLVRQLDGVPPEIVKACGQLEFRNTILVYLEVLNENPFPDNWIYVHSPTFNSGG